MLAKNKISIQNLIQDPDKNKLSNVIIVTHKAIEYQIQKSIAILSKNKKIFKKIVLIRIRDESKL